MIIYLFNLTREIAISVKYKTGGKHCNMIYLLEASDW